ncbi:hypothetical protein BGX31_003059 [Mortierella sp. GBA43]|nr:hypothetical protein BGX31_003059 [Mortierella sp. GBA43]
MELAIQQQDTCRAQQQALSLREIREPVAVFLGQEDILACCQVSKQWHQDWNPFYWENVTRRTPKSFTRYGHLIRNLELRFSSHPRNRLISIREHCVNMRSLHLTIYESRPSDFEEDVFGIQPAPQDNRVVVALAQQEADNPFYPILRCNGFLSDSLCSLSFFMPPAVCDVILPRLAQASRAGLLQGLRSFVMRAAVITYTCIDVPPPPSCSLKLSTIFDFLDAFPKLTSFCFPSIALIEDKVPSFPELVLLNPWNINTDHVLPTVQQPQPQQQTREHVNVVKLEISLASAEAFRLVCTKMPNVLDLNIIPQGSWDMWTIIQQHYPGLVSLKCCMNDHVSGYFMVDDSREDQKIKFKDWIQLFERLVHLERFDANEVGLPFVVLETLALSCPKLTSFKAVDQVTSLQGVQFMLRHCTALKNLHITTTCDSDFFDDGGQPWIAPVESLHFDTVKLSEGHGHDVFRNRIRQLTRLKILHIDYTAGMSARAIFDEEDMVVVNKEKRTFLPKFKEEEEVTWKDWDEIMDKGNFVNLEVDVDVADNHEKSHQVDNERGNIAPQSHYPSLQEMVLGHFRVPNEGIYWRAVEIMPRLRSLTLDFTLREGDIVRMRDHVALGGSPLAAPYIWTIGTEAQL